METAKEYKVDSLRVGVYQNRGLSGAAAGRAAENCIIATIQKKGRCRAIFAAAPSQNEVLAYLSASVSIDWSKVDAFHMDEYMGLSDGASQRFSSFLRERLFHKIPNAQYIGLGKVDPETEAQRYSALLKAAPIDLVCLGVGENGHIAFNDPPVANFTDPKLVKLVDLDEKCRIQQVNDGCFPNFGAVPTQALTLTIPALMGAKTLVCTVPGKTKAQAIKDMLLGPIATACPASILRVHADCSLYLDPDSSKLWREHARA